MHKAAGLSRPCANGGSSLSGLIELQHTFLEDIQTLAQLPIRQRITGRCSIWRNRCYIGCRWRTVCRDITLRALNGSLGLLRQYHDIDTSINRI